MIRKIRVLLEYNTYCLWLYDDNDEIIDNDNPPEWDDNTELTEAFMAVSDIYDTKLNYCIFFQIIEIECVCTVSSSCCSERMNLPWFL